MTAGHKITFGISKKYLFLAAQYLKDKQFTTAKKLARYLGIRTQEAGKTLQVLGWQPWSDSKHSGTYVR